MRGEVVREAFVSSVDTDDPLARAVLLERERVEAEQLARDSRRQVEELGAEMARLRSSLEEVQSNATVSTAAFARDVGTLVEHLRSVRDELSRSGDRTARLAKEIEDLQELSDQLRRERDAARTLAEDRYRQIEEIRRAAEDVQRQLRQDIRELEQEARGLRGVLQQLRSQDNGAVPNSKIDEVLKAVGDIRAALTSVHSQAPGRTTWLIEDDDVWGQSEAPPHVLR